MFVICPYEPEVHPLTRAALDLYATSVHYERLGPRPDAYWQMLAKLWSAAHPFALVEHDVEIHDRVVPALSKCPKPWCVFPYAGPQHYGEGDQVMFSSSLGCTRFRQKLMLAHPEVISTLGMGERDPDRARDWRGLDCRITARLTQLGYEPHVHWPEALHHHVYSLGCACGVDHERRLVTA